MLVMRMKGASDVLIRSVMSLYERAKTRFRVSYQKNLRLKMGCTKDLCCHLFFCISG